MTFVGVCVLCCSAIATGAFDRAQSAPQTKSATQAGAAATQAGSAAISALEAEVVANLKRQPVGSATVADLEMPDEYLNRVAGRILRASFEERFRIVVPDEKDAASKDAPKPAVPPKDSGPGAKDPSKPNQDSESAPPAPKLAHEPAAGHAKLSPMLWLLLALLAASVAAVVVAVRVVRRRGARAR